MPKILLQYEIETCILDVYHVHIGRFTRKCIKGNMLFEISKKLILHRTNKTLES